MTHWSQSFVGLPWAEGGRSLTGCDCWGLVRLVYGRVLEIELPAFEGRYVATDERAEIAALVEAQRGAGDWRAIDAGREADFDVIVMNWRGFDSHVGLVAGRGLMLHATQGKLSGVERYYEGKWRPRLCGFYRHALRMSP